jgi:hypothetical protein
MNDRDQDQFGRRIALRLSTVARNLDAGVAMRLHTARETALAGRRRPAAGLAALWAARWMPDASALRSAVAVLVVLMVAVAGEYANIATRVSQQQELDTALLSDDLPIDAYLDPEFKAWLQHASQS